MLRLVADRYLLVDSVEARPGGFSKVHKGVDAQSGRFVAIKIVEASDAIARKVYKRERDALRALDHPNIITLHDAGTDPVHGPYLVLDWVDWTLDRALAERGTYPWEEVLERFALPLADALAHAHLKLVEHRDIKPKNVLVRDDGAPVLADFGIGKAASPDSTDGTVREFRSGIYGPPEIEAPAPYVRDVYSLGVLLLQTLYPERLRDYHELDGALGSVAIPVPLRQVLERCLHQDPTARPANGSVLLEQLKAVAAGDQRARAARSLVRLRLTNTVRTVLVEGGGELGAADAVVARDLMNVPHAEFGLKTDRGTYDPNTVYLVGDAWRYRAKPDFATSELVVTSASKPEFDQLERARSRSLPIAGWVTWTTRKSHGPDEAKAGLDLLLRSLEEFYAAREEEKAGADEHAPDLLEGWLRLLAAREDLARGERQPLRYVTRRERGRDLEVILAEAPDNDLVGTEWEIRAKGWRYGIAEGFVVRHRDRELRLIVKGRRGQQLPDSGVLFPHIGPERVSLQRQRDAVSAIREGTAAHPDLRRLLLDPASSRAPVAGASPQWRADLDHDKRRAVEAALGAEDLLVVQGPPGTGKTSFITELVTQFLAANPDARVLIVSQTHVAVDNALERLEAAGVEGVVRLGTPEDPRVAPTVSHLLLDQRMAAWASIVRRRAEQHMEQRANAVGIAANELRGALALKELGGVLREQAEVEREITRRTPDTDSSGLAKGLGLDIGEAELQQRVDDLAERRRELVEVAQREIGPLLTLRPDMSADDADAAVTALLGDGSRADQVLRLLELQAEFLQRISSDRNLAAAYLQTTRVVAGTCLGFLRHPAVRSLDIDLCILDEASKATATEALVPIARARRSVLVGDTNQLPPLDEDLLRREDLLTEHELEPDFVRDTLFQRLVTKLPESCIYTLQEQYRMIQPIGDLVSSCFYDGMLRSPRTDGLPGYEMFGKPVLWLDTGRLGERRRESGGTGSGGSIANRAEAQAVVARVRQLDRAVTKNVLRPPAGRDVLEVLLIAPYRAQIEELRRQLARVRLDHLRPQVHTVDAVQGRETDIAIFSVTRSNQRGSLGFLGMDYWRRINVALSRARFGLTIVGDAGFCATNPGALHQVLQYMRVNPADCEIRAVDGA